MSVFSNTSFYFSIFRGNINNIKYIFKTWGKFLTLLIALNFLTVKGLKRLHVLSLLFTYYIYGFVELWLYIGAWYTTTLQIGLDWRALLSLYLATSKLILKHDRYAWLMRQTGLISSITLPTTLYLLATLYCKYWAIRVILIPV